MLSQVPQLVPILNICFQQILKKDRLLKGYDRGEIYILPCAHLRPIKSFVNKNKTTKNNIDVFSTKQTQADRTMVLFLLISLKQ